MSKNYSYMDKWNDEEVTNFKEEAKEKELKQIEVRSGAMKFLPGSTKIVAEGDSWFDYLPGTDLVDCLRNHHGYYIKNYAKAGDTLENMIYGTGINDDFDGTTPSIYRVLRKIDELKPNVFLFSGGGNDIAGDEFASYLNHANSNLSPLRDDYVDYMIHVVFKKYFEDLIAKVSEKSPNTHILTHGYGHTIPTGKGVNFLFFTFAGPWLRPALTMKRIFDPSQQRAAVDTMIDSYNNMLNDLAQSNEKFHHIDLRGLLNPDTDWANELHLKNSAYAKAADAVHDAIVKIQ